MIRKLLSWLHICLLNLSEPTYQDLIEINRSIGYGMDEIDIQIIQDYEAIQAARWEEYHHKYDSHM